MPPREERGPSARTSLFATALSLAALLLPGPVEAQLVSAVATVPPGFEIRRVEPGSSTTLVFDVTNTGGASQRVLVDAYAMESVPSEYTIAPGSCGVTWETIFPGGRHRFDAGTIAPGATRRCTSSVTRAAASTRDLYLAFMVADSFSPLSRSVLLGNVVDRAISLALVAPRDSRSGAAIVDVTVANRDGTRNAPAEFRICLSGDESVRSLSPGCVATTRECGPPLMIPPPNWRSVSITLGNIAPGTTQSCRLEVAVGEELRASLDPFHWSGTTSLVQTADPDGTNNFALLPLGVQPAPAPVPLAIPASALAALLWLVAAARAAAGAARDRRRAARA